MPTSPRPARRLGPARLALALACPAALLLTACAPRDPVERAFGEALRALDALSPAPQGSRLPPIPPPAPLPRARDRTLPIADETATLREYWSLEGCRLGALISQRNTSLGRVLTRSQRLRYELDFLRAAADCPLAPDQAARLAEITARKRAALPRHLANAVWAGHELPRLLSLAAGRLPPDAPAEPPAAVIAALDQLTWLLSAPLERLHGDGPLEAALRTLAGSSALGELRQAEAATAAWLAAIDAALARITRCDRPETQAALQAVFEGQHLAVIQPYLVRIDRRGRPLRAALARLHRLTTAGAPPSPPLASFQALALEPEGGEAAAWRAAVRRNAVAWQGALGRCGLPGG